MLWADLSWNLSLRFNWFKHAFYPIILIEFWTLVGRCEADLQRDTSFPGAVIKGRQGTRWRIRNQQVTVVDWELLESEKEETEQKRSNDQKEDVFWVFEGDEYVFVCEDSGLFEEACLRDFGMLRLGLFGVAAEFWLQQRLVDGVVGHDWDYNSIQ